MMQMSYLSSMLKRPFVFAILFCRSCHVHARLSEPFLLKPVFRSCKRVCKTFASMSYTERQHVGGDSRAREEDGMQASVPNAVGLGV